MSDVIESYIRRHAQMGMQQAMEAFLREERIQEWIGGDHNRRERLEREFARTWKTLQPTLPAPGAPEKPAAKPPLPSTPQAAAREIAPRATATAVPAPQSVAVQMREPPQLARHAEARTERVAPQLPARQLHVLCPSCRKFAVFGRGTTVSCASCGTEYDDMLGLIPAKVVGPFEFLFGEGWRGAALAAGLALLLAALYLVLRG